MPTSVPFAKKYDPRIERLLVELPINVPTTPCVETEPEIPASKKKQNEIIAFSEKKKRNQLIHKHITTIKKEEKKKKNKP
jgi:hypothetical protein